MPHLSFPFDLNGMFVDVMIAPGGDALAALVPWPKPRLGRAMIDTGTNVSGVSQSIIDDLGLISLDKVKTRGIGGEIEVDYYELYFRRNI